MEPQTQNFNIFADAQGMAAPRDVTVLVGAHTRVCNQIAHDVRDHVNALADSGVIAKKQRKTSSIIRSYLRGETDAAKRREAFWNDVGGDPAHPVFLTCANFLGSVNEVFDDERLYPKAIATTSALSDLLVGDRIRLVISIEPLSSLFAGLAHSALRKRISSTSWEYLYELSWAELIGDLATVAPEAEIFVLTPAAAALGSPDLYDDLFFGQGDVVKDRYGFTRLGLDDAGIASLIKHIDLTGSKRDPELVEELLAAFPRVLDQQILTSELGIDATTKTLLDQRFEEDLIKIDAMDRVRLL